RAKVQGTGNTLTLVGKLRPSEHGELLKFLRNAPASVHVIDHIEYDDTVVSAAGGSDGGTHPVPSAGRGAIHVVTDVIGATANLLSSSHLRRGSTTWCCGSKGTSPTLETFK